MAAPTSRQVASASADDGTVTLSWDTADYVDVWRHTGDGEWQRVAQGATGGTWQDTGLTDGGTFYYRLTEGQQTLDVADAAVAFTADQPDVSEDGGVTVGTSPGWEITAADVLAVADVDYDNLDVYNGGNISSGTTIDSVRFTTPVTISGSGTVNIQGCGASEQIIVAQSFSGTLNITDFLSDTGLRGEAGGLNGAAYYDAITSSYNTGGGTLNIARAVIRGWGRGLWADCDGIIEDLVYEMGVWFGNPATDGSHNEAITHRNTAHPIIRRARLDCGPYTGDGNGQGQQNLSAVVQIQGNGSTAGNLTLQDSWLNLATNLLGQPHIVADFHSPGSVIDGSINVSNVRVSEGSSAMDVSGADRGTWQDVYRYDPDNPPTYAGTAVS